MSLGGNTDGRSIHRHIKFKQPSALEHLQLRILFYLSRSLLNSHRLPALPAFSALADSLSLPALPGLFLLSLSLSLSLPRSHALLLPFFLSLGAIGLSSGPPTVECSLAPLRRAADCPLLTSPEPPPGQPFGQETESGSALRHHLRLQASSKVTSARKRSRIRRFRGEISSSVVALGSR